MSILLFILIFSLLSWLTTPSKLIVAETVTNFNPENIVESTEVSMVQLICAKDMLSNLPPKA